MKPIGTFVTLLLVMVSSTATAQHVVLTERSGRPLIVGGNTNLGKWLTPSSMEPQLIVSEFKRICLPDIANASSRAGTSSLELERADAVWRTDGEQQEARVTAWRGASAELSIWTAEEESLKGQPVAITSRAYVTTGQYGPFRAVGAQCNLVIKVQDFGVATKFADALSAAFGAPGKLVTKNTFSDGYWDIAASDPPLRINFTAPTTRMGAQPIHLSAQVLEKGSKR